MGSCIKQENYIKRCKKKHGNKFDYTNMVYNGMHEPVEIRCIKHNYIFSVSAQGHLLQKYSCPICYKNSLDELLKIYNERKSKKAKDVWVKKCHKIHGDKYDYSNSVYTTHSAMLEIICPIHGVFKQRAHNHAAGMGCQRCHSDERSKRNVEYVAGHFVGVGKHEHLYFTPFIETFFSKYTIKKQYPIFTGWYRSYFIDFVILELNLAIEYDEKAHKTKKRSEKDAKRQKYLEENTKFNFIRVDDKQFMEKGKEYFEELLRKIYE